MFIRHIARASVLTIFECGSRDCLDAVAMNNYYKPEIIYSFECNPESITVCEKNITGIDNIKLVPKAVYKSDCPVEFFPTDMSRSIDKNIGASSLLWHRDNANGFFQRRIMVEAIRLDTFMKQQNIDCIDLLCMDLQGAEHFAIEGLGKRINDVHYIITEVETNSFYYGDVSKDIMISILTNHGFKILEDYKGNMLFRR